MTESGLGRAWGLFYCDWWEAAVLFTTYQWGKPQLLRSKGAGENAEGARLPR